MFTLFIDAASHAGIIAICTNTDCIAMAEITNAYSEVDIITTIEGLFKTATIDWKDVQRLATVIGPGGFSSLRVSASIINTASTVLHIPICGLHIATILQARTTINTPYYWLHSTKKTLLFYKPINSSDARQAEPMCVSLEEVLQTIPTHANYCGELIDEHKEILSPLQLQLIDLQPMVAVLPEFLSKQTYSLAPIMPWYGREG